MKRLWGILLLTVLLPFTVQAQTCAPGQTDKASPDGYCEYGWWIPGQITLGSYLLPPPTFFETRTYYYAEGLMEETAALKGYDGSEDYVALLSPACVGCRIWIRLPGNDWRPVRVVDDVARDDYYYHAVYTHSGMEVSYKLAQELGIIDWINEDGSRYPALQVCVAESDPVGVCTGDPVDYEAWFESIVDFVP